MNLSDAEVVVTTQKEIDDDTHMGDWFRLSDYGDTGEFYNACYSYFPDENNPVFRYPVWENIPDSLINKEWFCPNFFEIRDALERLDESDVEHFVAWCNYHSHNIATDDPHFLVAHYQDNHTSYPEFESEAMDIPDDAFVYQSITSNFFDSERYPVEVFNDNYD
ncbi:hypothetical protein [Bacteroides sp. 51]|uniref:hypothetical protein n=1 Tax=Bacteroides sp. 51 TaxID=2302938 RepID=UPI0013D70257|nr:hypothetical protein [Bacteroides sp. 51]NDV84536.1 hypothetical protein [Bacteroides sp. 51]